MSIKRNQKQSDDKGGLRLPPPEELIKKSLSIVNNHQKIPGSYNAGNNMLEE